MSRVCWDMPSGDKHEKAVSAYFTSEQVLRFGFAMSAMMSMSMLIPSKQVTSIKCWASVVNVGPTLFQHWVNVFCLMARASLGVFADT